MVCYGGISINALLPVEDKITGRAILWTDNKGRRIMDRVYVIDTADIEFFKEFANKIFGEYTNACEKIINININGNINGNIQLNINLNNEQN
mgnify:CR=1 FL=1